MHIPKRGILACHTFICGIIQVGFHVIISINIIAMVIHKDNANTTNNKMLNADYGKRYNWSPVVQAYILSAYFWGAIPSCFMAGWFIQRIGVRNLVTLSTCALSILTALVPFFCELSWVSLCITRCLCGYFSGFILPCLHDLATKWIPPNEKGKFMSLIMSGNFGVCIIWNLCGQIIKNFGWYWSWEVLPLTAIIWIITFRNSIYNSPAEHPSITVEERDYILNRISSSTETQNKYKIPYKQIYRNCPVWSLSFLSFGNLWGLTFVSTYTPTYLAEILGEEIQDAGRKSGYPFLFRFFMAFLFGLINDYWTVWPTKFKRKFFVMFSHCIPGLALIIVCFVGFNVHAVVCLCVISQAFNGAVSVTSLINIQELSPQFGGTLGGLIGAFGTLGASLSIPINGFLTSYKNTIEIWHISFLLAGTVYLCTACIFIFFGSTDVQSFNRVDDGDVCKQSTFNKA